MHGLYHLSRSVVKVVKKNPEPIDTTCSRFRADSQIRTGDLILSNGPLGTASAIVLFHRETPYFSRLSRLYRVKASEVKIDRFEQFVRFLLGFWWRIKE